MGDYWHQTLPPPGNYGSWTQPMGYGIPQKDNNPPSTDQTAASTPYRPAQSPGKPAVLCDFCRAPGHFFRSCPHLGSLPEAVRTQVVNLRLAATSQNRSPRAIPRPTSPARAAGYYPRGPVSAEKHPKGSAALALQAPAGEPSRQPDEEEAEGGPVGIYSPENYPESI